MSDEARRIEDLARLPIAPRRSLRRHLLQRLQQPAETIKAAYARLAAAPADLVESSRAAEWLLDNYYIVQRAIRFFKEEFPSGFERRLPVLGAGALAGETVAYALAREIVEHGHSHIEPGAVTGAVRAFQTVRPLAIAEVWAVPILLRLVLIENLAAATRSVAVDVPSPAPAQSDDADQVVAACVRSLRAIEIADWKKYFESVNAVEAILRNEPCGLYSRVDFQTRDSYRKVVEELALQTGEAETTIAAQAVRLCVDAPSARRSHVGYFLIDAGFDELLHAMGLQNRRGLRRLRRRLRHPHLIYFGAIALLSALAVLTGVTLNHAAAPALLVLTAVLGLIPAVSLAIGAVNAMVTRLVQPTVLPKLDFDAGLPADCKTVVAVPALLTDTAEIDALLEAMEIRFLANRDTHLQFALLSDFRDAERAELATDAAVLSYAEQRTQELNQRHGADGGGPFHLLHRRRSWSDSEHCWMGAERKRGKLHQFNALLLGEPHTLDGADLEHRVGDPAALRNVRYVIALDADTELPRGAARRLTATLAHPLNRPEIDADGRVRAGYTVLQPRVEIRFASSLRSRLSELLSGAAGLDPYTLAVSDVYQDLFDEGVFVGKGIYDVAAFEHTLRGRVPQSTLLSHDLFEGVYGRAALATDIVLLEDYPAHYLALTRRMHRWVRGDWQLLPWLARRVPLASGELAANPLSFVSRWKIFDNLRRSLLPASLLLLLVGAWLLFARPLLWTLLILLVPFIPGLVAFVGDLLGNLRHRHVSFQNMLPALRDILIVGAFETTFLAHQAVVDIDAIARTLFRLRVSRRRLLEWTSAADTSRSLETSNLRLVIWRDMLAVPVLAAAVMLLLTAVRPAALVLALPVLLWWAASPEIAVWLSGRRSIEKRELKPEQLRELRMLARRTWLFFDTFAGPEEQWLPPDHFQEDPRGAVARRTSPTNIGLLLLSTVASVDFGYRGLLWAALRLQNTLETIDKLERYRGHLLNWYDTSSLEPLLPRYVSTVDSGNLVCFLLALRQSCAELVQQRAMNPAEWQGFLDTLAVFRASFEDLALAADALAVADIATGRSMRGRGGGILRRNRSTDPTAAAVSARLNEIEQCVAAHRDDPTLWEPGLVELESLSALLDKEMIALIGAIREPDHRLLAEMRTWAAQVHQHIGRMRREIDMFAPWLVLLRQPPELFTAGRDAQLNTAWRELQQQLLTVPCLHLLPDVCAVAGEKLHEIKMTLRQREESVDVHAADLTLARSWCEQLANRLTSAAINARYLLERMEAIAAQADRIVQETDFAMLYDKSRRLFYIGYDVTSARFDPHHYDLLASEARLASFFAIAKGDVPEEHWLYLGRPIGQVNGARTLLSWSGTMFEYLMPGLVLREDPETLLGRSCRVAVAAQHAYGNRQGVPWGISESAYYRFDALQNYQYRAFGVPALGFKRGLEEDMVVAPYASLMALPYDAPAVAENLSRFEELGALGRYGLYDALDFTRSRMPSSREPAIVRSFMAHHQGMIFCSLDNFFNDAPLVRRFHATALARTSEVLLFERPPREVPVEQPHADRDGRPPAQRHRLALEAWTPVADSGGPQLQVLSNGRYSVVVTDFGGGYSQWRKTRLTAWEPDLTLDAGGTRLFVRDVREARAWSPFHGAAAAARQRRVVFHPHQVETQEHAHELLVRQTITVAPDADVEIRKLTITNENDVRRRLQVSSYAEVVLDDAIAYRRHPAFSKLFVASEYIPESHSLLFHRRQRAPGDKPLYLLHTMLVPTAARRAGYETSREKFIGRTRNLDDPIAIRTGRIAEPGSTGNTLDPILSLTAELDVGARGTRELAFLTIAAESRAQALEIAGRYRGLGDLEWITDLARDHSETELIHFGLKSSQLPALQRLLSLLLYSHPALRAPQATLASNRCGRSSLWRFAVSGDLPILLVTIRDPENTALLLEVLRGQALWRAHGIAIDLVILNERASGYSAELDDRIARVIATAGAEAWLHRPGGVFTIHSDQIGEADRILLMTAARAVLHAEGGDVQQHFERIAAEPTELPPLAVNAPRPYGAQTLDEESPLSFDNGIGGFTEGGREYVIRLGPGESTPAPWVNVIANPHFGSIISESGGGFTWAQNSGENRLTPWRNDPVSDAPAETLYLRDEDSGEVWSATPLPSPGAGPYRVAHGAGYSVFRHASYGLDQRLRVFVPSADAVKVSELRITNRSEHPRRLTVTYYVEWVLGTTRDSAQPFLIPTFDAENEILCVSNPWNEEFADAIAFVAANRKLHGFTADRSEILGRNGNAARPAALSRVGLSSRVRAGADTCAALQVHLDIAVGDTVTVHFVMGQLASNDAITALVNRYRETETIETELSELQRQWDERLGTLTVRTPEPGLDLMLNRWLLYQALVCRVWARSAVYQSSGAFGFRDQLQDVMALVHSAPELARAHLLEAARHQFEQGDVLHWWHPPGGTGIRSRCSDDLLWLPFVAAHYVGCTGDTSILQEELPFLQGAPLPPDEMERYGRFELSTMTASLYTHCLRAIERGDTSGRHGLPRIGASDWNDGMNRVGIDGRGESVWLAWFLHATLTNFAPICDGVGDGERASHLRKRADDLRRVIESNAWDGEWYRRGYYDDGTPLGSAQRDECKIDSIAQSWAILSGAGDPQRSRQAMEAVRQYLMRDKDGLILLFTPPFDRSQQDPGYVKGYPPGIRENGGQYTHAALWVIWAWTLLGEGELAMHWLRAILPVFRSDDPAHLEKYRVEPYVIAADIYGIAPHVGRGGWTWYTGSASWAYRLGCEAVLGIHRIADGWRIAPCIPPHWPGYTVQLRDGDTSYEIEVHNPSGISQGIVQMDVDGVRSAGNHLPRHRDGKLHKVSVRLMAGSEQATLTKRSA